MVLHRGIGVPIAKLTSRNSILFPPFSRWRWTAPPPQASPDVHPCPIIGEYGAKSPHTNLNWATLDWKAVNFGKNHDLTLHHHHQPYNGGKKCVMFWWNIWHLLITMYFGMNFSLKIAGHFTPSEICSLLPKNVHSKINYLHDWNLFPA